MSDIPSEVFWEILLRLPAESVLRFKVVCKSWRRIIDDPSFIKAHTNNKLYSHTLLVRNETGAPLYSFSIDSLNFIDGPQKVEATLIKQLIRPGVPRVRDLFFSQMAACNGLALMSHENIKKIWAIWNPLTGECRELPQPNASVKLDGVGFGYDCDADDYKVVRIDRVLSAEQEVELRTLVYSLKSGSWSMIKGCPQYRLLFSPGAFLNGTLYWRSLNSIIALDLATESFWELPPPPQVIRSEVCGMIDRYFGRLDAMDGCLIFTLDYNTTELFDGWVMKDDGVEKSWIKLFSINYSLRHAWRFKLVAYLKSKRQVVVQDHRCFLWFDIGNNSVLKFSIHGFPHINSSQICSGSLVRLNALASTIGLGADAARKTSRKRKRKVKETNTRLKICVRGVEEECCSDNCFCSEDMCMRCSLFGEERYWETFDSLRAGFFINSFC
ncbi:hypothetical protein ACS0TY_024704 [Phlomoides rotata]